MSWHFREPTLTEILSDSIVKALMEADGVDPIVLETTLRHLAADCDRAPIAPDLADFAVFIPRRPANRSGQGRSHPPGHRVAPAEAPGD
jgi:hypothetical protein